MIPSNYNLAAPFFCQSIENPSRTALWVDGVGYSYSYLANQAGKVAAWLAEQMPSGQWRVGILTERSLAAYLGIIGTCWAGAGYVPLNVTFPEKRLLHIINRAQPDVLLVDQASLALLTPAMLQMFSAKRVLLLDGNSMTLHGTRISGVEELEHVTAMDTPAVVGPESEAYLVFTSGTTGDPSGVVITTANLSFAIHTLLDRYPFTVSDRFSQFFDLSFDFSVMDLFVPWQVGAATYVVPASQKLGPGRFIIDHQLTVWTCVPSMITFMDRMKMLKPGIFSSLRFSCFSGETLIAEAARIWQEAAPNALIVNLYGQTEAPIGSLVQPYGPEAPVTAETGGVALGEMLKDTLVAVLGENGSFVKPGVSGQLALAGPHVAGGYLDNPQRTAQKFQALVHPLLGSHTWYLSGDVARQDADGIFHYLGRSDNEVKVSGHRIMLEEIEHHLRKVTGCHSVAVVACDDQLTTSKFLIGFVAAKKIDEAEISRALGQELPRALVPRRIHATEELPLNQNGKVDRKKLVELLVVPGSAPDRMGKV